MDDDTPVDLKPLLKRGFHYEVADVLYRNIFQPISDLLDRLEARWTRKFCEQKLPK